MSDYNDLLNSLKAAAGSAANIARDIAGTAGDKARDLAGNAGEKARAAARIARLKLDIAGKREELNKAYAEIGRMYFESADKRHPGDLYVRLFDQVMLANAAIERMETEERELRSVFESDAEAADFTMVVSAAEDEAASEKPSTCPPSSYMAASKLRRVRVEGSKNSVASFLPRQASAYFCGSAMMSSAVAMRAAISSAESSRILMRLLISRLRSSSRPRDYRGRPAGGRCLLP